jgi:hypothetical protein
MVYGKFKNGGFPRRLRSPPGSPVRYFFLTEIQKKRATNFSILPSRPA